MKKGAGNYNLRAADNFTQNSTKNVGNLSHEKREKTIRKKRKIANNDPEAIGNLQAGKFQLKRFFFGQHGSKVLITAIF